MGIGKVLFQDLRFDAEGNERPDFPINKPAWRNAKIVVGARNFGCGSSREAAVYALYDYGVRCVIAPSLRRHLFRQCDPERAADRDRHRRGGGRDHGDAEAGRRNCR